MDTRMEKKFLRKRNEWTKRNRTQIQTDYSLNLFPHFNLYICRGRAPEMRWTSEFVLSEYVVSCVLYCHYPFFFRSLSHTLVACSLSTLYVFAILPLLCDIAVRMLLPLWGDLLCDVVIGNNMLALVHTFTLFMQVELFLASLSLVLLVRMRCRSRGFVILCFCGKVWIWSWVKDSKTYSYHIICKCDSFSLNSE